MKGSEIVNRFDALKSSRASMDGILQDIQRYVVPFRGEFYSDLRSEQEIDYFRRELYDNTANVAVNLLASQMHGNLMSPVVKWFGLNFRDNQLNTDKAAKEWLEAAEDKVWDTIQESNLDLAAPEALLDVCSFGTAIMTMEDNDDLTWQGVTFTTLPVMDAYFEAGNDGVYRIYRRLRYTALELDDEFDLPRKLKAETKNVEETDVDAKIDVIFVIYKEPENTYNGKRLAPNMRPVQWRYVHRDTGTLLKKKGAKSPEGGYYDFPAMVMRWQKVGGSRWGFSPAWIMLSDIKQLNTMQYMVDEAWSKEIDPPMKATDTAVIGELDNVPGGLTIVDGMENLQPLYNSRSNFPVGYEGIMQKQTAIRAGFFVDKLELRDSPAMTATEVQVRYERMLRLLAPTFGRLKADMLIPVVKGVFMRLLRFGELETPPESIKNAELDIEFTGPLARAMKGEVADGMERWLIGIENQAQIKPEVLDIVDYDEYNRKMAEQRGVPAVSMRSEKDVQKLRDERKQQEQEAIELAKMQAAGQGMKSLGEGTDAMRGVAGDMA